MGDVPNRLLQEALRLSEADRVALAVALLETLDGPPDQDVDAAWRAEVARRVAALDAGAPTIAWPEARAEIMRD